MEITLSAQKIIIDTDPGQDDAVAILLALASPDEIEVLGITAVAGNVPLSLTEKNARIICELAGQPNIGVYAGCDRPLKRKLVTAEHVHGKTGLDGPELPEPKITLKEQHGVDFIIDNERAYKHCFFMPIGAPYKCGFSNFEGAKNYEKN